ncbi:AIPR family protein [Paenibacillus sp. NPDC058910]|uniref:AIPR family protein n=1 Tax=unclassified Paenibacillus TaxID=185978 RepID=UPI00367518EF
MNNSNDQILLDAILDDYKLDINGNLKPSELFELFTADQILKENNMSLEEIEEGIVDGGLDGGIDSFYIFIDGQIIDDIDAIENIRRNVKVEIWIIQSKTTQSFEATPLDKIIVTIDQIFNFTSLESKENLLNNRLYQKSILFKEVYKKTASKFPDLNIKFCYASRGFSQNIHENVKAKEDILINKTKQFFRNAKVDFLYYGIGELLELYRKEKPYTLTLKLSENPIVAKEGYLALVKLTDYYDFITDENEELRKYIFDLNVRDYQGAVEVNKDIEKSLESDHQINFWVLNNGVTILADKGSAVAKDLTLENVQIVNGLQSSTSIYKYLKEYGIENEIRSILVKIIIKDDPEVIDKVIKASNFQTPIAISSLKATDIFQREIEEYFKKNDLFYDRRKGYYKNTGKTADKIISIPFLAQSIISIIHREPDFARARPSSLLKKESDYQKVFNKKVPLPVYLFCGKLMLEIQSLLRNDYGDKINSLKLNFKFHIAYIYVSMVIKNSEYYITDILKIMNQPIDTNLINKAIEWLPEKVYEFNETYKISIDAVAKSSQFKEFLEKSINLELTGVSA